MNNQVAKQDRFYQRGLVLGFTMAEIFVLIMFALLLSVVALTRYKDNQALEMKRVGDIRAGQLKAKEKELASLKEATSHLNETFMKAKAFDDAFRELVLAQNEEANAYTPEEKATALNAEIRNLKERSKVVEQLASMAHQTEPQLRTPNEVLEYLQKRLGLLQRIEQRLAAEGEKGLEKITLLEQLAQLDKEKKNLQGQLLNLEHNLKRLGTGMEMPACWAHPETGKPEFVFDVTLTSAGIIVHDNALPNRAEEQKGLPLGDLVYDKEMPISQFLSATRPLFDWSKNHDCRFVVRVNDRTGPAEKDTYKTHLWTVGQHFYYSEVRSAKF